MKKILIIGGFGFLGKNLNNELDNTNYEIYNESRRTSCDMLDFDSLKNKISLINPDIIINCSAHVGSIAYVSKFPADVVHDNTLMYLNLYKVVNEINPNEFTGEFTRYR